MSNPWDEFESSMPKREFEPAKPDPSEEKPARLDEEPAQGVFAAPATPQAPVSPGVPAPNAWDQIVTPTPQATPEPQWAAAAPAPRAAEDDLSVFTPVVEPTPAAPVIPPRPPKPPRQPRPPRQGGRPKWLVPVIGAVAAVAVIGVSVMFLGNMLNAPVTAGETPAPETTTDPTAPLSSLSKNPDEDLSFRVNLSSMSSSDYSLSNVTAGFAADGSGWTKDTEFEENGFLGYRQESTQCSVRWTQYAQETEAIDDYAPSIAAMVDAGGKGESSVEEYGYWSSADSVEPSGVAEVVETRVDADDVSVVVAARAVTGIDDVSVIWSMCDDPDDLDGFVDSIRSQVGFIIIAEK